jgi:hypothetical protein
MSDEAQIVFDVVAEEMTRRFPGVSADVLIACTMTYSAERIPGFAEAPQAALDDYAQRLRLALETCALTEIMRRTGMRPQ